MCTCNILSWFCNTGRVWKWSHQLSTDTVVIHRQLHIWSGKDSLLKNTKYKSPKIQKKLRNTTIQNTLWWSTDSSTSGWAKIHCLSSPWVVRGHFLSELGEWGHFLSGPGGSLFISPLPRHLRSLGCPSISNNLPTSWQEISGTALSPHQFLVGG